MKRRLTMLLGTVLLVGSLQVMVAPAASACADPNCPWSPVTDLVRRAVDEADRLCDEHTEVGCPL